MRTINTRYLGLLLSMMIVFLASCATQKKEEPAALTADQLRIMELVKFGPDPYKASAPVVTKEEKQKYAAIKMEFSAITKVLKTDEASAEPQLKAFMEKYPSYSGAAYDLAVLEKKRGNLQQAKEYLKIAIARNGKNLDALALQAIIARDEGDFANAEKGYKDILALWGGYLPAYKNLGILYDLYMSDPAKALPYYEKYNRLIAEPDKQVHGWVVDIQRRVGSPAAAPVVPTTAEMPAGQ